MKADRYLQVLKEKDVVSSWNFFRKPGLLKPGEETRFNVTLTVKDLNQFGEEFRVAVERDPEIEKRHNEIVALVTDVHLSIYKDLADVIGKG